MIESQKKQKDMNTLVILADDLSGACDTAVKLCGRERQTQVLINPHSRENFPLHGCQILALTTNTRSLPQDEAYASLCEIAGWLKQYPQCAVYKKVDSLLRGNVAREIKALMDVLHYDMTVLAPAIPDNARMVVHGKIVTSLRDPVGIDAMERLRNDGIKLASIPLETVVLGECAVQAELFRLYEAGYNTVIMDGVDELSLQTAARAVSRLPLRVLPAGASGWIRHLSGESGAKPLSMWKRRGEFDWPVEHGTLVVAGTAHPVARRQIRRLIEKPGTACVPIDVSRCVSGQGEQEAARCLEEVDRVMENCPQTLLLAVDSLLRSPEIGGERLNGEISVPSIVKTVAELTLAVIKRYCHGVLFAMGGETACQILDKMGVDCMDVLGEFMPGVPINLVNFQGNPLVVATKSGGFGGEDTITKFIDYLHSSERLLQTTL